MYVNLDALALKLCYTNEVPIKVKYENDLGTSYMISTGKVRLYQDPDTRASDELLLTQKTSYPVTSTSQGIQENPGRHALPGTGSTSHPSESVTATSTGT